MHSTRLLRHLWVLRSRIHVYCLYYVTTFYIYSAFVLTGFTVTHTRCVALQFVLPRLPGYALHPLGLPHTLFTLLPLRVPTLPTPALPRVCSLTPLPLRLDSLVCSTLRTPRSYGATPATCLAPLPARLHHTDRFRTPRYTDRSFLTVTRCTRSWTHVAGRAYLLLRFWFAYRSTTRSHYVRRAYTTHLPHATHTCYLHTTTHPHTTTLRCDTTLRYLSCYVVRYLRFRCVAITDIPFSLRVTVTVRSPLVVLLHTYLSFAHCCAVACDYRLIPLRLRTGYVVDSTPVPTLIGGCSVRFPRWSFHGEGGARCLPLLRFYDFDS